MMDVSGNMEIEVLDRLLVGIVNMMKVMVSTRANEIGT